MLLQSSSPGPASQTFTSGRSEVQPPDPTGQPPTLIKKCATSLPDAAVPVEELVSDAEQFSDRASSSDDEGEVSDLEDLLDVDQELSAEQIYRDIRWCEGLYGIDRYTGI